MPLSDQLHRRLSIGRALIAGRIDAAQARTRLAGNIGLGSDDVALLAVMELEAGMLSTSMPLDLGQRFSEFAQQLEDPMSTLRAALAAETEANAEAEVAAGRRAA